MRAVRTLRPRLRCGRCVRSVRSGPLSRLLGGPDGPSGPRVRALTGRLSGRELEIEAELLANEVPAAMTRKHLEQVPAILGQHRRMSAVVGRREPMPERDALGRVIEHAGDTPSEDLRKELLAWVRKEIGAIASPDVIQWAPSLPKTRSGKIMRRLLRELAAGGSIAGDVTTLEDFSVLEKLREDEE